MQMKHWLLTLSIGVAACSSGGDTTVAAGTTPTTTATDPTPLTQGVDYTELADHSDRDNWTCDNDTIRDAGTGDILAAAVTIIDNPGALQRAINSNSIPSHRVGDFPNSGNPNSIGEVDVSYTVAMRVATEQPSTTSPSDVASVAVSIGGVLFEPNTAEVYNNDRNSGWNYEALTIGAAANGDLAGAIGYLGTDCNNAHVQPTGKYHYHGMPEELLSDLLIARGRSVNDPAMVLVGYAADGYPLYARYGYADPMDSTSAIVPVTGSYELKTGTRPSGPGGSYDGTFVQDWEFVDGSGDLDACNGRYGVTPEFPNGIYHYFLTDDYPFLQRCVWGEPTDDARLGAQG
ncbi:MAG: YHYH protein [Pseudomonadota bacterium]